jgi:hypothetical protein
MSLSPKRSWSILLQTMTGASCSVFLLLVFGLWILASLPAPAIVDTNNNTLSDIWEKQYNNGNLLANLDPQDDPDGDGWTNIQEAAAGTNPFDPNPPDGFIRPDFVHIPETWSDLDADGILEHTPEVITLTWLVVPGKQYTLLSSPDLTEGSWFPVGEPFIGNGNIVTTGCPITQTGGTRPDKLFWRVAVDDIDTDGDSLSNYEESILGTNPNNRDTDLDGIADNLDLTPLTNNAIADPDGENLPASLATGLTGRWDLESITTTNGVRTSPNTANPSIPAYLGGAIEADNNGMVSKATRMSAMSQFIKTDPSIIADKTSLSISLWFRFEKDYIQNKPGTYHTILFAFNDVLDTTPQFQLHAYKALTAQSTQKLVFSHYSNGSLQTDLVGEIPLSAPLDDGNWQHLVFSKSTGTLRIYRNDQQIMTMPIYSGAWPSAPNGYLCFGALYPSAIAVDTNFRGSMDRIRTWSRAISQSEITALYHQDIDRDGLWDVTENNTRYSDYSGSVIFHPDPENPADPQPTQTGYARSPFLYSGGSLDFDQDELDDLAEQAAGTNLTKPDTDDDNLIDGFEVSNNFNPLNAYSLGATGPRDDLGDPDSDTLTTLTEYLNGSNPRSLNSDGDAKNDAAEIAQGSDPANAADSGTVPTDPPEAVPLYVNGDYTAWEATLKGKGPNDTRTRRFRMDAHNVAADPTLSLLRGNAYELNLRYIRTKPGESVPWYCWEATIGGKSAPAFTLADHWLVDNSAALLAPHTHSHGTNLVADKKVNIIPVEVAIRKKGESVAENGVLTKTGEVLEFALSPTLFDTEKLLESDIYWLHRELQADATYGPWTYFGLNGRGTKFEQSMAFGGIYQIKAEFIDGSAEYLYTRKKDEKIGTFEYGPGKKGNPDSIGICDNQIQIDICREAQSFYGSESYSAGVVLPAQFGFPEYSNEGNAIIRCNIFVAHRATAIGAFVPKINGFFNEYPPLANEWAGVEDTSIFPGNPTYIQSWPILPTAQNPQPGWIIAHPNPSDAGHCAIIDYDGEGIGAGVSGTVNKQYEYFWDGSSRDRKYEP